MEMQMIICLSQLEDEIWARRTLVLDGATYKGKIEFLGANVDDTADKIYEIMYKRNIPNCCYVLEDDAVNRVDEKAFKKINLRIEYKSRRGD